MIDFFVIFNAGYTFLLYVCCHWILLRFTARDKLLIWLVVVFVFVAAANVAGSLYIMFATDIWKQYTLAAMGVGGGVSLLLCALACFSYVICIVGPYETSVRVRLIRELYDRPGHSATVEELSAYYNPKVLLDMRLERLLSAGEVTEAAGGGFAYQERHNVFEWITRLSSFLKKAYRI